MAREAHELALRGWVELASGLASRDVRFWNPRPNAPSKGKPFLTVRVLTEASDGDPDLKFRVDDVFEIQEHTQGSVSVQVFGDDHALLIKRIETSLFNPHVGVFFDNNGIQVTRGGGSLANYSTRAFDARIEDRSERVFIWRRTIITEITGVESIDSFEPEGTFN